MREERGHLAGDIQINEPYTLWGSIAGNVSVAKGGKASTCARYIYGNLNVLPGGRVHIFGNVSGNLIVSDKSKVIHSGTLGGDATNRGGRLYIDALGKVLGKVRTLEGETTIEPQARISQQ